MPRHVVDRTEDHRYELVEDDGTVLGFTEYRPLGDALELPHTVIDPTQRGKGLGAELVAGALDDLRSHGRRIVPTCWYVAEFVHRNPAYADLLA